MKMVDLITNGLSGSLVAALAGVKTAVTAGTTQTQAGAAVLTGDYNVATVATLNDGVKLPNTLRKGDEIYVLGGANAGKLYPAVGGKLNGGAADASIALAASKVHLVKMISDTDAFVVTSA